MANAIYGKGRAAFGNGEIDWVDDDIKVLLVDSTDYTVSIDVDQYCNKDTIPDAARVTNGLSGNLANAANVLGVMDADDVTLSSVSGEECEALVIFKDGGDGGVTQSGTNDLLIAYIDTATGLPSTPAGGDITIAWDAGANKIFVL